VFFFTLSRRSLRIALERDFSAAIVSRERPGACSHKSQEDTMNVKSPTHTTLKRLIPPLTIWAIGKILETPSVKASVTGVDGLAYKKRRAVARSIKRSVKNVKSNSSLFAAGAAAIVVGFGLMAKATRK
jgi:hypothetical protein